MKCALADPYAEDIRSFTDEELRSYLAGHRSAFTVRELRFLDSAYEDSKREHSQVKVTIRWKTPLLNNH